MPAKITYIISSFNDEDCFKPFLPHNSKPNSIYSLTFLTKCAFFCNARKMADLKASEKEKEFWDVKLIKTCDKLTHSNKRDL